MLRAHGWNGGLTQACCAVPASEGFFADHLEASGSSLSGELQQLPLLAKCCALSGILSVISVSALSTDFIIPMVKPTEALSTDRGGIQGKRWDLLLDGALPAACDLVDTPCDPEIKYFALGTLTLVLQATLGRMQVMDSSSGL